MSDGRPPSLRNALAAVWLFILTACATGQPSKTNVPALLKQMTLEEKLTLVHGTRDSKPLGQAGYWPGLPRLGIPPLRLADGPAGVNVSAEATGLPTSVGLAATFDTEAARQYGVVLGRNAKALEQDILLAPYINIVRDPLFRRNHTTLGEDPFLNARLAAAEIVGIQSQGVMAQVKHLAGYNGPDSVFIDERTLHEIYLPAFEAAVKAGAASVMCAFNKVNHAWSCENSEIQNRILRGRWGFQGFVTSDWGAVHSPLAITKGVDLEMPGRLILGRAGPYFTDALKAAVESGEVPVSAIDQAVTRILYQMDRFHLLDANPPARPPSIDIQADAKVIQQIAEQAAVLLKNQDDALPLAADDLASLAVIGPTGGQVAVGFMAERAYGFESRFVSPLEALRKAAPQARITYSIGNDLTGVPLSAPPALEPGASYSWAETLTLPSQGDYTFMVQTATGDGSAGSGEILVDGRSAVRSGGFRGFGVVEKKWSSLLPTTDGLDNSRATLRLTAGAHRIQISADSTGKTPLRIRFAWMTPELRQSNINAAVAVAKAVGTPVVFVWNEVGEALSLPEDQDELIRRVAAANPRTIVVLNTGGPVAMPWKDNVRAILEMWYPGQEGGWATANLLLGRANPGGKLPVTFPVKLEDAPARAAGHPERWAPLPPPGGSGIGTNAPTPTLPENIAAGYRLILDTIDRMTPNVTFSEGIAVGYRWYDQQNIQPLFPFGHGLSYTRFQYSKLAVKHSGDGFDVTFTLRNIGSRKGAEVPQVYLGPVGNPPVPMASKSLAGFQRVELEPNGSSRVTIHIDGRGLSYWSIDRHDWVAPPGRRPIYVGSSSRDIRLEGRLPSTTRGSP
jgi:beta-glucosidase